MRRNFLLRDLRVIAQQVKSRSVVSSRNIWLVEEEVFNVTGIKGYLPPLRVLVAIKRHFGCQTDRQRGSLAFSSKIVKWKSRLRALSNLMKKALSSSSSLTHPSTPKVRPCLLNGVANPSRKQRQIHWTKATYVSKARYTGMVHSPKRKKKRTRFAAQEKKKRKKKKQIARSPRCDDDWVVKFCVRIQKEIPLERIYKSPPQHFSTLRLTAASAIIMRAVWIRWDRDRKKIPQDPSEKNVFLSWGSQLQACSSVR